MPRSSLIKHTFTPQSKDQSRKGSTPDHLDEAFSKWCASLIDDSCAGVYAFSYAAMDALVKCRNLGIKSVLNQIDPGIAEHEIVHAERLRFPGVEGTAYPSSPERDRRNAEEIDTCDVVVVNSEWSRDCLIAQGADESKIRIVPLVYDQRKMTVRKSTTERRGGLRVVWLGTACIRKGFHYACEAVSSLKPLGVTMDVYGGDLLCQNYKNQLSSNIIMHGQVPRSTIGHKLVKGDIYLLPTLSDGFALTQLEALSHGLPVIATPRCAQLVNHGESGLIVPPQSSDAIAQALEQIATTDGYLEHLQEGVASRHWASTSDAHALQLYQLISSIR